MLKAACPEVGRVFPEEPTKGFGVVMRDNLGLGVLKDILEAPLMNLAVEPGRDVLEGAHVASELMCLGAAPLALRRRQVMISGQLG